jgi:hypothetical protein
MTESSTSSALLQRLFVGYLANCKAELDDTQFSHVQTLLQDYLHCASNMVSIEVLMDRSIMRQAIHSLAANNTVEETVMFTFMLYIYRLTKGSSGHPLETGIIRQKIIGLLPWFEKAGEKNFIREETLASNIALLTSIADKTDEMPEALAMLASGYEKYAA